MKGLFTLIFFLYSVPIVTSLSTGKISLCSLYSYISNEPVVDAKVQCYAVDTSFNDDEWEVSYTDSYGCTTLEYTFDDDKTRVDIYCEISKTNENLFVTTKVMTFLTAYDANIGTIYVNTPTLSPSIAPTTEDERCIISEVDLVDVFTDWRKMILGIFVAAVLTLPAVSVYWRNTEQNPMKSYFYSCIIKFVSAFFSISILTGGLYEFYELGCTSIKSTGLSFVAAFLVEAIEFILDVGRLIIFFGDPGTLDFYQTARWNSNVSSGSVWRCFAVGLSSLPIAFLMICMWIMVLMAQFAAFLTDGVEFLKSLSMFESSRAIWGIWIVLFAVYATCSFSCVGAYYLMRMICPCGIANDGEEKGLGLFWGQFKVVSIDLPSLIATIFINPSTFVFFWTAEFINDTFPTVAGFVIEKYLQEEEDDDDEEDKSNTDVKDEDDITEDLDEEDDKKILDLDSEISESILLPLNFSNFSKEKLFNINREFPPLLNGDITESVWIAFCDEADYILEPIIPLQDRKPDRNTKISFVALGLLLTFCFWVLVYPIIGLFFYTDEDGESVQLEKPKISIYLTGLILCCIIGGYFCVKLCFARDVVAETDVISSLEEICEKYTGQSDVYFNVKTQNGICTWLFVGGLSCTKGVDSIQGIECMVTRNTMNPDTAEQ
jgi:hypothetical protein